MNVLLVEDERQVADFVKRGLTGEGWIVEHVMDGESALARLKDDTFDVVLLDLILPGISGLDVCRTLRARGNIVPVLMLSALDATDERVSGLRVGADDYLPKPFEFDELVARLTALVRRAERFASGREDGVLVVEGISLDTVSLVARIDDTPLELTARERDILKLLLLNPDRAMSRERILNAVWGAQEDPQTNIVDVYIARLRKKLGKHGGSILTVRGTGYRLARRHALPDTR